MKAKENPLPGKRFDAEAMVQPSSNQMGLFNRSSTANRMGNQFGKSVYPQRPPTP